MTDLLRLIVFDFDGTLCDSAGVKTNAFHALYLDEHGPEFADAVRRYHLDNAGVSRYDKIRHIESAMLGHAPSPGRVQEVADRFSELVEHAVIAAPLFPGVASFLERAHPVVPLAVASATPTEELERIVAAKGIDGFFASVDGSPRSKGDILRGLVDAHRIPADAVVMVGDQSSDVAGAVEAGTQCLIITEWPDDYDVPTVASFAEAAEWLAERSPLNTAAAASE